MASDFITLTPDNIANEHICCAFSDKKCAHGYRLKKDWLTARFAEGYVFRRLRERAKVFIEYTPAEVGWTPVEADNYLLVNCFWVSGQYKGKGYGKALLQSAIDDAHRLGKYGLAVVAGTKKFHFMADPKWLQRQGFTTCATLPSGFSLLVLKLVPDAPDPSFAASTLGGQCEHREGIAVYYSDRCPFTDYHVNTSLRETAAKRNIPLHVVKLGTNAEARQAPSPATVFSLFYNGRFVTTDVSVCMDSRFDKIVLQ